MPLAVGFQDIVIKAVGKVVHVQGNAVIPGCGGALGLFDLAKGNGENFQGHLVHGLGKAVGESHLAAGATRIGIGCLRIKQLGGVNGWGAGETRKATRNCS